jgi:hypothetical protein
VRACLPQEAAHPRVVTNVAFSPLSGARVLSTCIDNRLRVWDAVTALGHAPPREIVHSHDFGRYLTPFRATFDPKDALERLVVCGRYISEGARGATTTTHHHHCRICACQLAQLTPAARCAARVQTSTV